LNTNQFYAADSSVPNVVAAYNYDSQDRIQQVLEPRGTNAFTYDKQGHMLQIATPEGVVNYEYEPIEGRRVRTYTVNSDLRYGYDLLGRISTVTVMKRDGITLTTPEVTTNNYTALGSLQKVYFPNGAWTFYQYDLMNRVTNVVNYNGTNGILSRYQYALGTNGVVKSVTETRLESNATYTTNQIAYTYDNLGRLTKEASVSPLSEANYTNSYVYSLVGNLLWRTNGATGEVIGYSYNTNDQLTVENSSVSGLFTNKYDWNGSLTNRASVGESSAYGYDFQNKLVRAVINRVESGHTVAITASYTNNYAGLRVRSVAAESVDGGGATVQTRLFLRDAKGGNAQVLEELPAIGSVPTVSYTIGGKVLSQSKNGVVSHLLGDGHGSTRLLTGPNGAVTDRYSFDAYGKMLGYNPGVVNQPTTAVLYSGEYLDRDLQQYYLQARYYNPSLGRYGAIDPFSPNQQSGANLYAYCGDDPINGSDPSGQYEVDVHRFLTQFLAREAGFTSQAEWIGRATQALDDAHDGRGASFDGTLIPNWSNMRKYHFVSKGRLQELRNAVDFNNPLYGYLKSPLGEYLHAYEDTFAHSPCEMGIDGGYYGDVTVCGAVIWGGGGVIGHGAQFHDPDHTWMEPEKALKMAKMIYGVLKDHAPAGSSPTDWSAIEGKVQAFVQYPPNVYLQYGFVQNPTFNGYNQKIKLLDSTFVLDQKYKDEFYDVPGFSPSNDDRYFYTLPTVDANIDASAFSIASFGFL
jgi:RHS repeat-associated protein